LERLQKQPILFSIVVFLVAFGISITWGQTVQQAQVSGAMSCIIASLAAPAGERLLVLFAPAVYGCVLFLMSWMAK